MEEQERTREERIASIKRRLNRIEGQLKGIQRMVEQDTCCSDILIQVSAVRAAITKVGVLIMENHLKECVAEALTGENKEEKLEELVDVLSKFIK